MTIFKASNGIEFRYRPEGFPRLEVRSPNSFIQFEKLWRVPGEADPDWQDDEIGFSKNSDTYKALAEYFQFEKDQKIGAWRCPSNPMFVVYKSYKDDMVNIVDETTGFSYNVSKKLGSKHGVVQEVLKSYLSATEYKSMPQEEGTVIKGTGDNKSILQRSYYPRSHGEIAWYSTTGKAYTDEEAWDLFNGEFVELVPKEDTDE